MFCLLMKAKKLMQNHSLSLNGHNYKIVVCQAVKSYLVIDYVV